MKAVQVHQFGAPEVLKVEEIPTPTPNPGQVLIRVHAAGVSPLDTYVREQSHGAPTPSLPYIPGSEAAGVIETVGEGVTKFKTGDRVYVNTSLGAYAELIVHDAELVYPLPSGISFAQATAAVSSYPTAYYGLFNLAKAKPGETVFVHGASGAVGSAAVQIARAYGLKVVGSAGSQQGLQLIEKEGAHFTVNHREPGYLDKALEFTDGKGFDVILEMNATKKLADDVNLIAPEARIIIIGGTDGAVNLDPTPLLWKGASIIGLYVRLATPQESAQIHAAIYAGLENGTLRPAVAQEFALSEVAKSHEVVRQANSSGKVVLKF